MAFMLSNVLTIGTRSAGADTPVALSLAQYVFELDVYICGIHGMWLRP